MFNAIKIKLQYFIPQLFISRLAGFLASQEAGWLTQIMIKAFAQYYRVDMAEAQHPEFLSYRTFNEFFVRRLGSNARPINNDHNTLVFPADGIISQLGPIQQNQIMQAKGHHYTLQALLAGNHQLEDEFRNGLFITTYLAPRNYHRVHMPCEAVLREMIYVPGDLFSVNPLTTENIPNLFARNERVICVFDTAYGTLAQILVGATIVGSIVTVWAGVICPPREGIVKCWTYPPAGEKGAVILNKGEEMGHFKLGSTVINLFSSGQVAFSKQLRNGTITHVGETLATGISSVAS